MTDNLLVKWKTRLGQQILVKIIVPFANVQKINEWVVRLTTKLILLESLIPVICSKQLFVNKVRQNYQL